MTARFALGRLSATPGAVDTAERHDIRLIDLVRRHITGDWGTVDAHDRRANDHAVNDGTRIISAYGEGDAKLWIITEADREYTTILRPDEY